MRKVQTWLPVFSGFYNTAWQADETQEIDYINEQRSAKGLDPITYDDCDWDYADYEERISKGVTNWIGTELVSKGFISSFKFEKLVSPREYNFKNDSINVVFVPLKRAIRKYLRNNLSQFAEYLKQTYTSRSGFISFYPNNIDGFMVGNPLEDSHKLGAILNFILLNEGIDELSIYEDVTGNTGGITCKNYESLCNGSEPVKEDEN